MVAYSFKKRFVPMIRVGLGMMPTVPIVHHGESFGPGGASVVEYVPDPNPPTPKRQTIRAIGKRRHARPCEILQLYTAMRTKQCEKIGDACCTEVPDIYIGFGTKKDVVRIFGSELIEYTGSSLDDFARADGFPDWDDLRRFWDKNHPGVNDFHGVMPQWEPM